MNTQEVQSNIQRMARTHRVVRASEDGSLPTKIEVLQAGTWDTPYHGIFEIHVSDLEEMVANFNAGVAMAGGSIASGGVGLPIDFGHESGEEAAGWIKDLMIEGLSLYAKVEWTAAGTEALTGGNYKCFSPEFYPKSRGGWPDPERYDVYIPNVLVGGGLTNIPLFKGLKPVMASTESGQDKRNVIYISASEGVKHMPTLQEVLDKDPSTLTDADKTFLTENKASLTDEQKIKFGFEVTAPAATEVPEVAPVAPVAEEPTNEGNEPVATPIDQDALAIAASVKSGEMVVIKASALQELQDTAKDYRLEKARQDVMAHAQRGAIAMDQVDKWAKAIIASADNRALLEALPSNAAVSATQGSTTKAADAEGAVDKLHKLALEAVKASAGKVQYADAIVKVRKENADLAQAADAEISQTV